MPDTTTTTTPLELIDRAITDHEKEGTCLLRLAEDHACNYTQAAALAMAAAAQFTGAAELANLRIALLAKCPVQTMEAR